MTIRSIFFTLTAVLLFSGLTAGEVKGYSDYRPSSLDTTIYILTCSPGTEVYSAFGHTALLYEAGDKSVVFNYGTFNSYDDNFIWKFSRGKLPYALSLEDYGRFQLEYLHGNRQIIAQELNLTRPQIGTLVRLLYENSLPENKYYQYDFFYDNCSTRILEILNKATKEQIDWGLSQFSEEYSFRDIIDIYLENQEWTDLGIDLALGLPCDKILEPGDQAFLPDSFQVMCSSAKVNGVNLVKNEFELLPAEESSVNKKFTERTSLIFILVTLIFGGLLYYFRHSKWGKFLAKLYLFINGIVGILVFSLWFFTDHTATALNMNLMWANPLNLIFIFVNLKKWWKFFILLLCITLISWPFVPQDFHESLLPLIALFIGSALILAFSPSKGN